MNASLSELIFLAGIGQLGVLVASALVPFRLNWKQELASLPRLHRQMYLIYGGYVVLGIVALGTVCLTLPAELASGTPLARAVCAYGLLFWGVRLGLQAVLDARPFLTVWWIRAGYHLLTLLFLTFTVLFARGALPELFGQ